MSEEDRKTIHTTLWLAIGTLKALREKAPSPSAVDSVVKSLEEASGLLMKKS